MQLWQKGQKARRRPRTGLRKESKSLEALSNDSAPDIGPVRRLFRHVHRQWPHGNRLAGELNALGGPVRQSRVDVARRRTTLSVSPSRRWLHPIRQHRRRGLDYADTHRDRLRQAQEKRSARQSAFRKGPIGPHLRHPLVARQIAIGSGALKRNAIADQCVSLIESLSRAIVDRSSARSIRYESEYPGSSRCQWQNT